MSNLEENNLNLFQIFDILISKIFLIIIISLILFLCSFYYIYKIPNKLKVSVDVETIDYIDLIKFHGIKVIMDDNMREIDKKYKETLISSSNFEDSFIDKFMSYNQLSKNFYNISNNKETNKKTNIDTLSLSKAKNFYFERPTPKERDENYKKTKLIFEVNASDLSTYLTVLNKTVKDINSEIYSELLYMVSSVQSILNTNEQMKMTELESQLEYAKRDFLLAHDREINNLIEQSWIARQLNIDEGIYFSSTELEFNEINVLPSAEEGNNSISFEMPQTPYIISENTEYLKGYKALENQLEKMQARNLDRIELYDANYTQIYLKLDTLKKRNISEQIDLALSEFPSAEDFKSVKINTNLIKKETLINKQMLNIFMLFSSILIAIIIALVVHGYKNYKNN